MYWEYFLYSTNFKVFFFYWEICCVVAFLGMFLFIWTKWSLKPSENPPRQSTTQLLSDKNPTSSSHCAHVWILWLFYITNIWTPSLTMKSAWSKSSSFTPHLPVTAQRPSGVHRSPYWSCFIFLLLLVLSLVLLSDCEALPSYSFPKVTQKSRSSAAVVQWCMWGYKKTRTLTHSVIIDVMNKNIKIKTHRQSHASFLVKRATSPSP